MDDCPCRDRYPSWMVLVTMMHALSVYAFGLALTFLAHPWLSVIYVAMVALMECRLLRKSCTDCYYHGQRCAFGRGRLSGRLFPPGDGSTFRRTDLSWKVMAPDVLMTMFPVLSGAWALISTFSWWALLALASFILLITAGNSLIRGNLACRHCVQREMGCPAERLFNARDEN